MEHAYAQALWRLIESGTDTKKAVHMIHDLLVSNGRQALMPRVGRAFARIAEREIEKNTATLTVAREHDEKHARKEAQAALKEIGIDIPDLKTQIDDTLIGGWRLEAKGQLIDASYKSKLLEVFTAATR